jgi:hypothetical protein
VRVNRVVIGTAVAAGIVLGVIDVWRDRGQ